MKVRLSTTKVSNSLFSCSLLELCIFLLIARVLLHVQWNRLCFRGRGIPKCMGSNPGHILSGDWASTRGNSSQMGELSDRRSPLGGLL